MAFIRPAAVQGLDVLRAAGFVTSKLALAAIVMAYSFEVVSRYVFNAPTWWSAELVSYLLCVLVFTMMPHVTATGGQIAVTVVLDLLPPPRRRLAMRIIYGLGCVACAAMAYFASGETARQIARSIQMMAAYPIPKWWVSIWIGIGFALSAVEFLRLAVQLPSSRAANGQAELPEL